MRKYLLILVIAASLITSLNATVKETQVKVVLSVTNTDTGRDNEDRIKLTLEDNNGNTFDNVYYKSQIEYSEKSYSYIVDNSNCIYLNEKDYKTVMDENFAMNVVVTIFWLIFGAIIIYVYLKFGGK